MAGDEVPELMSARSPFSYFTGNGECLGGGEHGMGHGENHSLKVQEKQ